jgi:ABC-type enterobactin transport system permease subunit
MPLIRAIRTPLRPGTVLTVLSALTFVLLLVSVIGLTTGSVAVPAGGLLDVALGTGAEGDRTILLHLRLPRVLPIGFEMMLGNPAGADHSNPKHGRAPF